jgi:putative hydrolase of the HAD superfamily
VTSPVKAVFFDAGHTLIYAHPDLGTLYAETTARFGARLPPKRFVEAFVPAFIRFTRGPGLRMGAGDEEDRAMWRRITRSIHERLEELKAVDFDPWFDALYRRFGEPEVWKFYDDVEPTLGALRRRGMRLGVVSNWDTRLRGISAGLGLDRLVDFVVISAEVGVRKPDPRIFEEALRRAGVRAGEAVHVGDLPEEDVEGARRAGLGAFLIDREKRVTARNDPPGVPILKTLAEILQRV